LSTTNDPSLARTAQAVSPPDVIKLFLTMTPLSTLIVPSMTELLRTIPPPKRSREPWIRMESITERLPPAITAVPVVLRRQFFTVAEFELPSIVNSAVVPAPESPKPCMSTVTLSAAIPNPPPSQSRSRT